MAIPKIKMLTSLSEPLTRNAILPYLNAKSLYAFTWTCKRFRNQYKARHDDTIVAAKMLHCVLNPTLANQTLFHQLLSIPKKDLNGEAIYLIRNFGEEVYFNKERERKTKTKRGGTSVLEAILKTGNFHLARILFNCIPEKEKTECLKKYIKEIKAQGIWGMPELQAAYNNFLDPRQALYDAKTSQDLN